MYYTFVCVENLSRQTHSISPLLHTFKSKAISEHIDVSSGCAAGPALNTDPEPQVTSPNPAHYGPN